MASNEDIIAKLPIAIEKLNETNKRAAEDAAYEDRIREKTAINREKELAEVAYKRALKLEEKQELREIERARDDKKQREQLAAERAGSTAGQALELKATLESQGKIAEDSKEFQELSYKARKEDRKERLKNPDLSPAAKKDIKEEAKADAKKNGSRLDKIVGGIGNLFEISKKGMKAVALGGLALLSTLAIGGLLIALGKFLQSDTFKELTKYIQETLWPAILSFGAAIKEYFTGPRGLFTRLSEIYKTFEKDGFFAGIKKIFDNISGVEAIVLAVAAAAFLPVGFLMTPFALKIAAVAAAIYILMELFDFADKEAEKLREKRKEILGKTDKQKAMFAQQTDDEYESGTIGKGAADYAKTLGGDMDMGGSTLGVAEGYLKNEIRKKAERDKEGTEIAKNLEQAILVRAKLVEKGMKNSVSKADKIIANLKKQLEEKDAENLKIDKGSVTNEKGVDVSTATGRDVNDPRTSFQVHKGFQWDGQTMTKEDGTYVSGVKPTVVPPPPKAKILDVMADRRIAGSAYKPGRGQDMGEEYEEPSMQMANFAKSKTERDANAKSNEGSQAVTVNAPSSQNIHNNGSMSGGGGSLSGGKYGQLNRQEQGGMI